MMNEIILNQMQYQAVGVRSGNTGQAVSTALHKYRDASVRAKLGQVWSALMRRPHHLLDLRDVRTACALSGRHYAGIRSVPIRHIRGSEGRSKDFDADFQPLRQHTRERWMSVAIARGQGVALPAVELIQVGDLYFVRDGHHRVSVAKARGQEAIDAEVTVWDVVGPLPWERQEAIAQLAVQPV